MQVITRSGVAVLCSALYAKSVSNAKGLTNGDRNIFWFCGLASTGI